MQRANAKEQEANRAIVAAVIRVVDAPFCARLSAPPRRESHSARLVGAMARVLRAWRRRERDRRELAAMRGHDFGDLSVPPALIAEELRRWPWQPPSPQWGEAASGRRGSDDMGDRQPRGAVRTWF